MRRLKFNELFNLELEGWRIGLEESPHEITPGVIHAILSELEELFIEAIKQGYAFNPIKIGEHFEKASGGVVNPKQVAFKILSDLPNASDLSEEENTILKKIFDKVEDVYQGALERFDYKFNQKKEKSKMSEKISVSKLSFDSTKPFQGANFSKT